MRKVTEVAKNIMIKMDSSNKSEQASLIQNFFDEPNKVFLVNGSLVSIIQLKQPL